MGGLEISKWVLDGYIQKNVINRPDDAPRGSTLEVDLTYDEKLHDDHNNYPAAPTSFKVKEDLSDDQQRNLLKTS